MNDYIELKDKFKIDDSHSEIRGFVIAKTEDGKIVFTKENMIVKSGRKLILKMLTSGGTLPSIYPASGSEYRMTLPEDNIDTTEHLYSVFGSADVNQVIGENAFSPAVSEESLEAGQYYVNENDLYIRFKLRKEANVNGGGTVVSSFGLAYESEEGSGDATGYELFSRVTFPSYPDSAVLLFDYYIYF